MTSGTRCGPTCACCSAPGSGPAGSSPPCRRTGRDGGRSAAAAEDSFYVYRRTGEPCRICGTEIRTEVMAARNLFWCPTCQPE